MAYSNVPPSGVWAPAITFFNHSTNTLDLEAQAKYYAYLSKCGLAGLLVLGTNSETFLLTREERKALLQTARQVCEPGYPIMAGVGGHSTKQVLEFIADAAEAGADYALLLPPLSDLAHYIALSAVTSIVPQSLARLKQVYQTLRFEILSRLCHALEHSTNGTVYSFGI